MTTYTENTLELTTLDRLKDLGYEILHWPDIAHDGEMPMRESYQDVLLIPRLETSLAKINPEVSQDAISETIKKLAIIDSPKLLENNRQFHKYLTDGVDIETRKPDGSMTTQKVWLVDFKNPNNNTFSAVNQFTIIEGKHNRRPDVLLFVNGIPLGVIELKNLTDEKTTIKSAYNQIQTYKNQIPSLFTYNEINIISDGVQARVGSLSADYDRFMKRRSIDGETVGSEVRQLETTIKGLCTPERLLDVVRNFVIFQQDGENIIKILWAYHQYFAVKKAIESTGKAVGWDHKAGVIRHTQGSGKSLSMVFYAGQIIQELNNPTLVILTDRNDLDDQLFGTFSKSKDLLRQNPQQATSVSHLKELLNVASGGVIFTTIQKFSADDGDYPVLSTRENIVVIADEAHRTQYGLKGKVNQESGAIKYGFAKYLRDAIPNASFIGFTGTPIEKTDANTREVFGEYIDIYDIARAIEDGATVPIYYEARLAKINLSDDQKELIDAQFEELTEQEELDHKEKLKSKRAKLEAMIGSEKRLEVVAKDIVTHFENRLSVIDGKWMIVCMSRRIAVDLYEQIIKLKPERHHDDLDKGAIKVVMTGSASDPENFQPHITNKKEREDLAIRMKKDPAFKLVIVRDMWLTGFDVPSMHTMYVDKPMQGHWLMQAIARVNRVHKDKQAGLVVDYIGIASQLKQALSYYTQDGNEHQATIPIEQALDVMHEKHEVIKDLLHKFEYQSYFTASPTERTEILSSGMEYVLGLDDGKKRFVKAVTELGHAFSIAMPHEQALKLRDEVAFFQAIKVGLLKFEEDINEEAREGKDYDHAIRQIVSGAISSGEVIDIFRSAWLDKPELSILSDEFLDEVQNMKHKNMAFELLKRLLNDNIKTLEKKNLVKSRSFLEMLESTIKRYQNRTIESAEVIAELIELAKHVRTEQERWNDLGLSDEEVAFYDALVMNESAVKELGDETLKAMAHELVELIRKNAKIDRTVRSDVQAKLRVYVKRLLKKYKYPPDLEEKATEIVLKQAELTCRDWTS